MKTETIKQLSGSYADGNSPCSSARADILERLCGAGLLRDDHLALFRSGAPQERLAHISFIYEELYRILQHDSRAEQPLPQPDIRSELFNRLFDKPVSGEDLVAHARSIAILPTKYVFGGLVERIMPELIGRLASEYPDFYTKEKIEEYADCSGEVFGCDCSGLVKSLYFGFDREYYDPFLDRNSLGLLDISGSSGDIPDMPEQLGIILYMEGHLGIYAGRGQVIESTVNPLFGDGVVSTDISARQWTRWFRLPFVYYPE